MSKAPISKVTQSYGYMRDKACHKWWNPNDAPNLDLELDLSKQVVVVTGSNTGIGRETALQLAKRGAKVVMACRDLEKAEKAKEYILGKVPNGDVSIMKLDLGDLSSIREFVKEFESKFAKLDILVNNAGVMNTDGKLHKTKDGFEFHVGVNHLGPFLLTRLLISSLKRGTNSK